MRNLTGLQTASVNGEEYCLTAVCIIQLFSATGPVIIFDAHADVTFLSEWVSGLVETRAIRVVWF